MGDSATIGEIQVLINGDWSDLQTSINEAAAASETGASEIAGAFNQVTPAVEDAGGAAEHAGESFHNLSLNLGEAAEIAGLAVGFEQIVDTLKEFIADSIEAASDVQFLSQALGALTGSAAAGNEILEQAATIAQHTTASFLDLGRTAQSFAALGVSVEAITPALQALAEWSEVSGRNLDSLSSVLERVALSGTLNARTMATLGITAQDMADVMGISAENVKDAFKALGDDITTRAEIIAVAMHDKAGAAATELEATHRVALNALKTAWHEFAADVGEAILPALDVALKGLGKTLLGVAEAWAFLSAFLKDGVNVAQGVTDGIKAYADVAAKAAAATQGLSTDYSTLTSDIQKAVAAALANVAAQNALDESNARLGKGFKDTSSQVGTTLDAMARFDYEQVKLATNMKEAVVQFGYAIEKGEGISRAYADVEKAGKALGLTQDQLNEVFARLQSTSAALPLTIGQVGQSLHDLIGPILDDVEAEKQWEDAFSNVGRNVADPVTAAIDQIIRKSQDLQAQFDEQLQVFARLAASSTATSAELKMAWDELKATADALGVSMTELAADVENVNAQMENLPVLSDQARGEFDKLWPEIQVGSSKSKDAIQQINTAIERDLSKALTDAIFQTGKVGDAFKKLGEDVVDIVLNHIIKDALKPLLDMLDNVLAKIGLGAGAGGGAAGAAGGAAGGVGNAAGGVGGAIAGAASGVVGMVGAIGAVGSFVTGVIGDIQTAHQTDVLRSIEYNTRVTAMWIGPHGGGGVGDWTWQTAINTQPLKNIDGWIHNAWTQLLDDTHSIRNSITHIENLTVTVQGQTTPAQFAQAFAQYLKNLGPQFSP